LGVSRRIQVNGTRFYSLLALLGLFVLAAPRAGAEDETNPEVVKAARALFDAKRTEDQDKLKEELLARSDLDWPSLRKAMEEGPYYQKPLVTAFGQRGSRTNFDLVFSGEDGVPRGFSLYVPKSYDAETPIPVLFYLHHSCSDDNIHRGSDRAGVAVLKFRKMCEEHGILLVAPYTSKGAEWWTPQGIRLIQWTLKNVRRLYKIDDDRIGLMGALDGGDSVWAVGQAMPGTWSVLMPMTGDPYEMTAIVRPIFLATLDRMDILMGVSGTTKSTVGEKDLNRFLADLKPMFGQRMRITTSLWPTSQGDFSYLDDVTDQIAAFVLAHKRKPYPDEVDVEVEEGETLRSLWLDNGGYCGDGIVAPHQFQFHSTQLKWSAPERKEPDKKLGVNLEARAGWEIGMVITATPGEARNERIFPGDVLLEVDGVAVHKVEDLKDILAKRDWKDEVHLVLAREVKESELARHEKSEERYRRYRAKVEQLRSEGKPIPNNLWAELADPEEENGDEAGDEDDGCGELIIGGDDEAPPEEGGAQAPKGKGKGKGKPKAEPTEIRIIERWVALRRPAPDKIIRDDFGAIRDHNHDKEGVKVGFIFPGSLADRSGLKTGDVIVQVGDTQVKDIHDLEDYFRETHFKFEDETEPLELTIRRPNPDGTYQADRTVSLRWKKVRSSRVDARWDKKENSLFVLCNNAAGFTLYFNEELVKPGEKFHLFINNVPFQDLVNPAAAPDYPEVGHDSPGELSDRVYRMRRERALVDGWQPDLKWALDAYLEQRDRRQVYGGKLTVDLTTMTAAFEKANRREGGRRGEKGEKVKAAYDKYRETARG